MSGMEPEIKAFLKRVLQTVSAGMLFLIFHMTVGLYFNWAFFEKELRPGNIIYYLVFAASLLYLIYYYLKLWKGLLK